MAITIHAILLILGGALLVLGILSYSSSRRLIMNGAKIESTVIENIPVRGSEGGTMYKPLLEYQLNGKVQTFSPNASSNPPAYRIGEKVTLIYDGNTGDLRILSYWGVYLASNVLLAFALPMLLIGGGYFLFKAGII